MCVVSIIRVPKVKKLSLTDPGCMPPVQPPLRCNADKVSGTDVDACVWSMVEVCVAIVCACLPTCRVLFSRLVLRKRVDSVPYLVDMPRYPSLTADERRPGFRSKYIGAQVEIVNVVRENWAQVPACE